MDCTACTCACPGHFVQVFLCPTYLYCAAFACLDLVIALLGTTLFALEVFSLRWGRKALLRLLPSFRFYLVSLFTNLLDGERING
jgi:hypothetical protein